MSSNAGPERSLGGEGGKAALPTASRPYWIGVLVALMGAVWLYDAARLPQGARYAAVGPGLFVTLAGLGLVVLGIILIVQIARGERFEPQDVEDADAGAPMNKAAFFTALLAAALPIVTIRAVGLPLAGTISFALVARALGSRRPLLDIVSGAVLCGLAYLLFTHLGLQIGGFFPPLGL